MRSFWFRVTEEFRKVWGFVAVGVQEIADREQVLTKRERMKRTWREFVTSENIVGEIRPEILEAWKRSKQFKVDPFQKMCPHGLDEKSFEARLRMNAELIETSLPVMQRLFDFVKGSGFVVLLIDSEGFILAEIGDGDMLERTRSINAVPGFNWSEHLMGANAIGTSLAIGRPIQFLGYEHWCICTQVGTCSAAPIHDPDTGRIIGVLDMTGMWDKVHHHTLGMVVAGAGWIENQLATQRNAKRTWLAEEQKTMIMEAVSDGIIAVDSAGSVTYINRKAGKMLGIGCHDVKGRMLSRLMGERNRRLLSIVMAERPVKDEIVTLAGNSGKVEQVIVSSYSMRGYDGAEVGRVAVLQELARVNRIVDKVFGGMARHTFDDLVGKSKVFRDCITRAMRAAQSSSTVLLLGESGTGKDVFAQAIHNASPRARGPFLAVNCAAIPKDLLASELFGYAEGAFTGAKRGGSPGKFELANGGTIFLDEVGEMPLDMQTALLRVIEEKAVMRIGGQEIVPVDARIIAATNRDLKELVAEGRFRPDLFYRLNVLNIKLPALRDRKEDIPLLAEVLLGRICRRLGRNLGFGPGVMENFMAYDWPGNIRELQNVIESLVVMCSGSEITLEFLPEDMRASSESAYGGKKDSGILKGLEAALIEGYLNKCSGNKSLVAKELGISRSTLYRRLNKLKAATTRDTPQG